jgi:dTDP-4-dehydrorhamnose 3,5-epimerase
MSITFEPGRIPGVGILRPDVHLDRRGLFVETFDSEAFASLGLGISWVQDSVSRSDVAHTVRGFHFQHPPRAQAKLVRVSRGSIVDAVVDLRTGSPTFGEVEMYELSEQRWELLFVPVGLAHGFCTLESNTEVSYKMSDHYSAEYSDGIRWDDPTLGVRWPAVTEVILSERDLALPGFADFRSPFRYGDAS